MAKGTSGARFVPLLPALALALGFLGLLSAAGCARAPVRGAAAGTASPTDPKGGQTMSYEPTSPVAYRILVHEDGGISVLKRTAGLDSEYEHESKWSEMSLAPIKVEIKKLNPILTAVGSTCVIHGDRYICW